MLDNKAFDLWSDNYDETVNLSEQSDTYPFAGYKNVLNTIYTRIKQNENANIPDGAKILDVGKVLDIGIGTAVLSKKLYDEGYKIYGIDFSSKMLRIAQEKMPDANLIQFDFSGGVPEDFIFESFDFIICTYAIHHLDDDAKIRLISQLLERLKTGGKLYIGDVAFASYAELEKCRNDNQDIWDNDEIYPVLEVFSDKFKNVSFSKISFCSGVFTFSK